MLKGIKTMKAKYTIEVEMKEGFPHPFEKKVEEAIRGSVKPPESIQDITVAIAVDDNVEMGADLFAYGQKKGGRWVLLDFFNTRRKAANACARARSNTLLAFRKDGEFAVFQFNPRASAWIGG